MGYSGPPISGVSINNPGTSGSLPGIDIARLPGNNRSRDANLNLDRQNPGRALDEGRQKAAQIGNFMNFFNKSVTPFLIKEQDRRARQEAGEAIDAYPSILTAAQDDPQAMDRLNALSPRAKDFAIEASMKARVNTYGGLVNSATMANWSTLTDPNDSEEAQRERALLRSRISSEAREQAFAGMPPYQIAINAAEITAAEKAVGTAAYTQRGENIANEVTGALVQGAAADMSRVSKEIMRPAGEGSPDSATRQQALTEWIVSENEKIKARLGTQDATKAWMQVIVSASFSFSTDQERVQFLEMVLEASDSELLSASGRNIWTIPFKVDGGGTGTIRSALQGIRDRAQPRADQELQEDVVAQINQIYLDDTVEDKAGEIKNILQQNPGAFKQPGAVYSIMTQIESFEVRETPEMQKNSYEAMQRIFSGEDPIQVFSDMAQAQIATDGKTYTKDAMRTAENAAWKGRKDEDSGMSKYTQVDNFLDKMRRNEQGKGIIKEANSDYIENYPRDPNTGQIDPRLTKIDRTTNSLDPFRVKADNQFNLELAAEVKRIIEEEPDKEGMVILQEAANNVVSRRKDETNKLQPPVSAAKKSKQYVVNSAAAIKAATARNNGTITIPWEALDPLTQESIRTNNQLSSLNEAKQWFGNQSLQKKGQWYKESLRMNAARPEPGKEDEFRKQIDAEYKKILKNARGSGSSQPTTPRPPRPTPTNPRSSNYQSALPRTVPITEQERQESGSDPFVERTIALLDNASSGLLTGKGDSGFGAEEAGRKWFNNNGQGPIALVTDMTGSLLSMALGGAPANASPLFSEAENIKALQDAFGGAERQVSSPQLPQLASTTPVRMVKNAITSVNHELFIAIGINEGTRSPSGEFTDAYYGHRDPGDGNLNVGTVSGGRGRAKTPDGVDREYMRILTEKQYRAAPILKSLGLQPGTVGYNRVMFNILDLEVQAPAAVPDFIRKLGDVKGQGFSIDAIAKARADSFFTPEGNLDAPGFNNNYSVLLKDQRSRAGAYDFKKRL